MTIKKKRKKKMMMIIKIKEEVVVMKSPEVVKNFPKPQLASKFLLRRSMFPRHKSNQEKTFLKPIT